ncbi:hypothetical protein [Bartonella phoceensis]|uniref:hypothetical protein n=1 Tax=Bartonella phoceensis TaxID=270249 RepID=UPI001ABB3E06|nr:hypothetical protein [Bartonella phoceensis]
MVVISFINEGGTHTTSVVDSAIGIVCPSSAEFGLSVEQSGETHFILRSFSGTNVKAY